MDAEQLLEKYLLEHPDYWDFENEVKEVERLRSLCDSETTNATMSFEHNCPQL